ncbi:MAG TPA: SIS domain-containing protein, partial [Candidatus Baltobacteraceae bacterium]|nr:SIS domain-containing protein [Candidatus Baltobacteraceae bacterium]
RRRSASENLLMAMLDLRAPARLRERILARNERCLRFFERESVRLARASYEMAQRFRDGGRLLAFGKGAYATDAMHLSVEFIHPVLVGKRALAALDVSAAPEAWIESLAASRDMVVSLGPPEGDRAGEAILSAAHARGAMTLAWPGTSADYAVESPSEDAHVHQELFELLGHSMYETVQVFLEHVSRHRPVEGMEFLYPFLGETETSPHTLIDDVATSIRVKARDANALRAQVAADQSDTIARAAQLIGSRIALGGRILAFGNGGSATDATDFALDCVMPSNNWPAIPAISLALEPAVITATANDVGSDLIFLRQLIAQCRPGDVAMAFSTSGGSRNVVAALEEAGRLGLATVALLGYDGGEIVRRSLADVAIVVRSDYIPRIQEAQGTIYHVLREALAEASC